MFEFVFDVKPIYLLSYICDLGHFGHLSHLFLGGLGGGCHLSILISLLFLLEFVFVLKNKAYTPLNLYIFDLGYLGHLSHLFFGRGGVVTFR